MIILFYHVIINYFQGKKRYCNRKNLKSVRIQSNPLSIHILSQAAIPFSALHTFIIFHYHGTRETKHALILIYYQNDMFKLLHV